MSYDLSVLSPPQFEALSADLVGREISVRFEQFGEGPDGGIDGRHAKGPDSTILQAKHFAGSGYSKLKSELRKERVKIDQLNPTRYILSTSVTMTPTRKTELMEIIGPSCLEPADIFGSEDLFGLLRNHPDLVKAHPGLWRASGIVLKEILHETLDERERNDQTPRILQQLLPADTGESAEVPAIRDTTFLLGSRPEDDEFILWLGPKLEAHGFAVFSEILTLEPGHRWRRELNRALEHRAAKVLVTASAASAGNEHVMDFIDKAREVGAAVNDAKFIIPLRLENGVKLDGLRDAVAVDFIRGWGDGLNTLVKTLKRQGIAQNLAEVRVAPQWDSFRKRGAIPIVQEPEQLVSNWLAVVEMPNEIHYYEASGVVSEETLKRQIKRLSYPAKEHGRGVFSFADPQDIADSFGGVARLKLHTSIPVDEFADKGLASPGIKSRDAANMITHFLRDAWERHCREKGMISYDFSGATGFHVSSDQVPNGQKIKWGKQGGGRRSSMLRNVANKHVWKYGVSAVPRLWPFWHVRLKARVLFAEDNGTQEGKSIDDPKKMHRLRRSGCKGWRNKQWHGRLLAFLELMSAGSAFIRVPLAPGHEMLLSSEPILFTSPVRTSLPDVLDADGEEQDETTLGRPEVKVDDL